MKYFSTRTASLVLAFGLFFAASCAQFDRSSEEASDPESYHTQLEQINQQLEDDPDDADLQLQKAELLTKAALETPNPENRHSYYQNLRDVADSHQFADGSRQDEFEEWVNHAWTEEQGEGVRLLQQTPDHGEPPFGRIVAHFNNAITVNPDSLSTYNLLANTYYRSGDISQAIQVLEDAGQGDATPKTETREQLAYLYLEYGEVDRSIEIYEQLALSHPNSAHLRHGLANAYIINEQHTEATSILRELSEQYPTRYEYREALATQLYYKFDRQAELLIADDDGSEITSDDTAPLFEFLDEVDNLLDELRNTLPFSEEHMLRNGAFYKNSAQRLHHLREYADEDHHGDLNEKAAELYEKGMPVWEKLVENHPDNTDYIRTLHSIYLELGKSEEAETLERTYNF